ncbi:MAG: hypothetical protein AVDCRST_MAG95-2786 [uncultured Adhaeribacter sp.]|uniref:Uncharacterized protein n=1 Tax=uncultured Adhaeribacter sp. TaxID=448109 RepID=A0A6J4JAR6_9BACT|nr:MAG: hypothetical protein AVDCRST_MAG95-2786 [uncultured Adhaeribacter sp.]
MKNWVALLSIIAKFIFYRPGWQLDFILLVINTFSSISNAQNKQWDKTIGGTGNDYLSKMVNTPDGGYILGGTSDSGFGGEKSQPSKGGSDFWIVKIDADSTKVWDCSYGAGSYAGWRLLARR